MKYVIEKEKRPVYLQLYSLIRDDIVNGIYPYNSKLPLKEASRRKLTLARSLLNTPMRCSAMKDTPKQESAVDSL